MIFRVLFFFAHELILPDIHRGMGKLLKLKYVCPHQVSKITLGQSLTPGVIVRSSFA